MKILRKLSMIAVEVTLLSLGINNVAKASYFITPDNLQNQEGNSEIGFLVPYPSIFQQVYNASQFGSTPLEITQIAFRPDSSNLTPFNFTIGDIQFYFATTNGSADNLSSTFADNITANYTEVFDGTWTISSQNTLLPNSTKAFDIILNLTTPFIYDPNQGNLLLEYKKYTPETTGFIFDSETVYGDSISTEIAAGDANATVADPNFSSTMGLVTQFEVTPLPEYSVPESSPLLSTILFAGILGLFHLKFKHLRQ
jgi:hypothetical protein